MDLTKTPTVEDTRALLEEALAKIDDEFRPKFQRAFGRYQEARSDAYASDHAIETLDNHMSDIEHVWRRSREPIIGQLVKLAELDFVLNPPRLFMVTAPPGLSEVLPR